MLMIKNNPKIANSDAETKHLMNLFYWLILPLFLIGLSVSVYSFIKPASVVVFERTQGNLNQAISPPAVLSAEKQPVKLLFLGDLMFDRNIRQVALKNGNNFIFGSMKELLTGSDLVVVNLEGPITDNKSLSMGTGSGGKNNMVFTFDPSLAGTLFENNIRIVSLGNNHILNFGSKGLQATEKYLSEAGIEYFGEPNAASTKNVIKDMDGLKIGFVGYNQFIGESKKTASTTLAKISELKSQADIVIVYAHWGVEYAKTASPSTKNLAHEFIDAGADLIIGSHPHVVQDKEEYKGRMIFYSLGNFVFDQYFSQETMQGLGVGVKIDKESKKLEFEEIQIEIQKNGQVIIR